MSKGILSDNRIIGAEGRPNLNRRPTEMEIAVRAYEIYLARGGEDGHDLDDWLQAERELSQPSNTTPLVSAAVV